jgi:hypothetical protein
MRLRIFFFVKALTSCRDSGRPAATFNCAEKWNRKVKPSTD